MYLSLSIYIYIYMYICMCAQLCPALWDHMNCSLPGSSVHGVSQARTLEWVALSYSRRSSWPRDWNHITCIGRWILYYWATWEALTHSDTHTHTHVSIFIYISESLFCTHLKLTRYHKSTILQLQIISRHQDSQSRSLNQHGAFLSRRPCTVAKVAHW